MNRMTKFVIQFLGTNISQGEVKKLAEEFTVLQNISQKME
jgi:hypothetical protein